jgi:aspartate racemase
MSSLSFKPKPVVGILGGMGPRATVVFLQELINQYRGRRDSEIPRIVVDFQTQLPSRSRHVLYGEASPVSALKLASERLIEMGATFVAIPCNSACALMPQEFFERGENLNIIDSVVAELCQHFVSDFSLRVLILAGPATVKLDAYGLRLSQHNWQAHYLDKAEQIKLENLIERIKLFGTTEDLLGVLQQIVSDFQTHSTVDVIVLACTELEELPYRKLTSDVPIVGSSHSLVKSCYKLAGA